MVWAIREVPLICLDSCNIRVVHLQPYYMCSFILVECFAYRNMFLQLERCHCYEFKRRSSSFPLSVPGYTCILYVHFTFRIKCLYVWVTRSHLNNGNHKAEQAWIQQDPSILKLRRAPSGGVVSLWVLVNGQMWMQSCFHARLLWLEICQC